MSAWRYTPEKLKRKRAFDSALFDYEVKRAREIHLWGVTPEYYDAMSQLEYLAWHEAWAQIVEEKNR